MTQRHISTTAAFAVVGALVALSFFTVGVEAYTETRTLDNDSFYKYWLPIASEDAEDKFEFSLEETSAKKVDFYILSKVEYDKFYNNENFTAVFQRENVSSFPKTEWICPDDLDYYLVVDNQNIGYRDDAYANDSVTVKVYWKNKTEEKETKELFDKICGSCMLCIVGVIVVIILIVVVIVFLFKKKKQPTPYVPPQQPYQQQPYQPPPPQ